jgi:tetrahydromethanopterin S-methyltransferase subunit E
MKINKDYAIVQKLERNHTGNAAVLAAVKKSNVTHVRKGMEHVFFCEMEGKPFCTITFLDGGQMQVWGTLEEVIDSLSETKD